ncbi:YybH family protein [Luteimonas saliphila]|uniref:YybH family protein n=1 Tax=Luteimonas saliphila TaxID=2804919 RepID=UPI00192D6FD7|nr:nuclear transport factor 2 family protein [Luteimonas saliphila]
MRPRAMFVPFVLAATLAAATPVAGAEDWMRQDAAIREVIAGMQDAWNRGDFEGYMAGFQDPGVVFVSRGRFQRDWQGTLDHYIADYGGAAARRGTLCFYDIRIERLADDAAQLVSRFRLAREAEPQYGINTRLMRRHGGRWVIALNHVSAVDTPDPADALLATACP